MADPRICNQCGDPFEPIESIDARLKAKGSTGQKVCASCVMATIGELAAESVFHMTDEEIEAELRADGVDVEAFTARTREVLEEAMRRHRGSARLNDDDASDNSSNHKEPK